VSGKKTFKKSNKQTKNATISSHKTLYIKHVCFSHIIYCPY